jgi:hypothetical protein
LSPPDSAWNKLYQQREAVIKVLDAEEFKPVLAFLIERRQEQIGELVYRVRDEGNMRFTQGAIAALDAVLALSTLLKQEATSPESQGY